MGLGALEPNATCDNCGAIIYVAPSRMKNNKHHFCSTECCRQFSKKDKVHLTCAVCGKDIYRKKSAVENIKNISHATCSKECAHILRKYLYSGIGNHQYGLTGSKNKSWKSDIDDRPNRYTLIRVEDHPFRDKSNFVPEHRLIAEKFLLNESNSVEINGEKYLKPECVVHHIDFNKKNNNVNNLYVFDSESLHSLYHTFYKNGRVSSLDDFFELYTNLYTNKVLNYEWMYMAHIICNLTANQINKYFDIPYRAVKNSIKDFKLNEIKNRKNNEHTEKIIDFLNKYKQSQWEDKQ